MAFLRIPVRFVISKKFFIFSLPLYQNSFACKRPFLFQSSRQIRGQLERGHSRRRSRRQTLSTQPHIPYVQNMDLNRLMKISSLNTALQIF